MARTFITTSAALSLLLAVQQVPLAAEMRAFRFAFIADDNSAANSALSGARQGINEANLQGRFLGLRYALDTFSADIFSDAEQDGLQPAKYVAILADLPAAQLVVLSRYAARHAVFNLTAKDDPLRQTCLPNLLHTIPSITMYADAERQWLTKHPDAKIIISGWHADFVKFAARDLNKRYKKAFALPMNELAWSGWAAVKMSSDLIARGIDTTPPAVLAALKTELAFDGQKGMNLNFRNDGQLRQPLLIADDNGRLLGEAPVRGVVDPNDLDSLGARAGCRQ